MLAEKDSVIHNSSTMSETSAEYQRNQSNFEVKDMSSSDLTDEENRLIASIALDGLQYQFPRISDRSMESKNEKY